MSINPLPQSSRPSPPESPPVDTTFHTKQHTTMDTHLPQTPQSPPLPSNKRKRGASDDGGLERQKKINVGVIIETEGDAPGIEALHRDVGPPYQLATTQYPKAPVDVTQDLFKVYGVEHIAEDVARSGPNPKKMGKTYKKHMRLMKLSGKFDAVKKNDNERGLFDMLHISDERWDAETRSGNINIKSGFSQSVRSSLSQAMTMSKGRIPKERWDPSVLALAEPAAPIIPASKAASINTGPNRKIPSQGTNIAAPQSRVPKNPTELARPQRNVKKRTYTDDGFEGYGEGYADDMADDGAFRPGDEDRQQRRKKEFGYHHFPGTTSRHAGYGPGTVGA